jgi:hypothetical protein
MNFGGNPMINFLMGAGVGVLLMIAAASIAACQLSSQCSREEKQRKTAAMADAQKQPAKSDTLQCGRWHLERLALQGWMGAQDLLNHVDGLERDNQALQRICTELSKTIARWRTRALDREVEAREARADRDRLAKQLAAIAQIKRVDGQQEVAYNAHEANA